MNPLTVGCLSVCRQYNIHRSKTVHVLLQPSGGTCTDSHLPRLGIHLFPRWHFNVHANTGAHMYPLLGYLAQRNRFLYIESTV